MHILVFSPQAISVKVLRNLQSGAVAAVLIVLTKVMLTCAVLYQCAEVRVQSVTHCTTNHHLQPQCPLSISLSLPLPLFLTLFLFVSSLSIYLFVCLSIHLTTNHHLQPLCPLSLSFYLSLALSLSPLTHTHTLSPFLSPPVLQRNTAAAHTS